MKHKPKINHILHHKTHHNRFKRTEVIGSMFSDSSRIKLEINHKKITEKSPTTLKSNTLQKFHGQRGYLKGNLKMY